MAILDRTRMNLARQFLRTPAIIRPYIRSVLILQLSGHATRIDFSRSTFQTGATAAFVHEGTPKSV